MTQKNDGGPAFSRAAVLNGSNRWHGAQDGMSLRDWFAGQALAGIASMSGADFSLSPQDEANWAYERADAMLAARDKD